LTHVLTNQNFNQNNYEKTNVAISFALNLRWQLQHTTYLSPEIMPTFNLSTLMSHGSVFTTGPQRVRFSQNSVKWWHTPFPGRMSYKAT